MFQSCRQAKRQCRGNLSFSSCCLFSLTRLDDRGEREREREREYSDSEIVCWCAVYNCVSLLFDTFTTVLVEQFSKFLSFWGGGGGGEEETNFFAYHQATVRVPPVERAPQFEKHPPRLLESVCTLQCSNPHCTSRS